MPSSQIPWILDQPEHILSVTEAHIDTLEADYTFDPYVIRHLTHIPVIRRDLTRHLGSLTSDLMEEIGLGFDQYWGSDTENWKEVCVYDDMMRIVASASNRVLVGLPLCRNQEFLMNAVKFVQSAPFLAQFIKLFPKFLKPVIGSITTIPSHYFYSKCAKHLVPLAEQRIADLEKKQREFGYEYEGPADLLTWMIHDANRRADTVDQSPEVLCRRMLIANFASLHTTTFTITNVLFDLIGSPYEKSHLAGIREEMERVLREDHGVWTKAGLTKLVRADSAIKETMRLWGILGTGLVRKVISDEGITLENGLHLNKGVYLGVPSHGIHHDETLYPQANVYDASRFCQPRETPSASQDVSVDDVVGTIAVDENTVKKDSRIKVEEGLGSKGLSATTTSDTFLSFSLGRHACPGRFFAVDLLKLLMAYAILHYEIKPLAERPSNTWFGEALLPPMKATIHVKRRRSKCPMVDGQLAT
ncbi:MAG: hypothetical protein M1816_001609 [Peltula sp. TS41687]|nr:MAG: hypothetical protein M1816_001609 [Peltula sp. TS41687]